MPPGPRQQASVLVVDDSPAIRARVEGYLRELGYADVRTAGSVAEGLERFRERPADLVLLDLVIEEERGFDFASQALAERPLTDILILTALAPGHDQVTAVIAEGARGYVQKPVTLPALRAALARLEEDAPADEAARRSDPNYA